MEEYGIEETTDPLAKDVREKLTSEFGDVITVDIKGNVIAFRYPSRAEVRRYRQTIMQPNAKSDDEMEKLLTVCAVWPSREAFTNLMDRFPMALGSTGIAFMSASGFDFTQAAIVK